MDLETAKDVLSENIRLSLGNEEAEINLVQVWYNFMSNSWRGLFTTDNIVDSYGRKMYYMLSYDEHTDTFVIETFISGGVVEYRRVTEEEEPSNG